LSEEVVERMVASYLAAWLQEAWMVVERFQGGEILAKRRVTAEILVVVELAS
jgi:hypothetical protein